LKLAKTLFYIFLPVVLGGIVGILTSGSMDYQMLELPPLAPAGFVFPIVWTILYFLMGISYAIVQTESDLGKIPFVYYLQLGVNLLWPIIFFVLKWRFFAIIWIILLLGLIVYLMILMFRKNKISFYLLIPYLVWTIFATYLTIGVYILN